MRRSTNKAVPETSLLPFKASFSFQILGSKIRNNSLGVDLVEIRKAASLYRSHRRKLEELLDVRERRFVAKSPKPAQALAVLLAAKEAVFKASGMVWMGPAGFSLIGIRVFGQRCFSFRLTGRFARVQKRLREHRLVVRCGEKYVWAACLPR